MNLEDNNIDELFKEHLGNEPVAFDESAWEQAQSIIAKPSKKFFPLFWRATSLVLLIGIISTALYFGYDTTSKNGKTWFHELQSPHNISAKSNLSIQD